MKANKSLLLPLALLLFSLVAHGEDQPKGIDPAQSAAESDPVLKAMREEMLRSMQKLRLPNAELPYYIEYGVTDLDRYQAEAVFGVLRSQQRLRTRLLRVVVRIGDYSQDNSVGQNIGTLGMLPLDDDIEAMRHQIWLATDTAYKEAVEVMARKRAILEQFQSEKQSDDFSREAPSVHLEPISRLDAQPENWTGMLKNASGLFRNDPALQNFQTVIVAMATNRYFVNSEGTVTRTGATAYDLAIIGATQAPDGMRLERSKNYPVTNAADLPDWETFKKDGTVLLGTLKMLREAPLVDDEYSGPVLVSGDAATSMLSVILRPAVLANKPNLGSTARTASVYASSLKTRVMPDFLNVTDDPTIVEFRGEKLLGAYAIDDEGVKAQAVPLVESGKLVNYLVGRQPVRDFPNSNGHGRSPIGMMAAPQVGNLFVRSSQPVPTSELKKRLLNMCGEQGRPYCYYVETTAGLTPRLIYRVYTADGREELVRGASFDQLDTRTLRSDIVAAGDDEFVENIVDSVSQTIIAPSLLFGELKVQRMEQSQDKLPYYPAPKLAAGENEAAK